MSVRVRDLPIGRLRELCHERIQPRIPPVPGDRAFVDSTTAVLV